MTNLEKETLLFEVVKRTLAWAGVDDITDKEIWDLIMLELINLKEIKND